MKNKAAVSLGTKGGHATLSKYGKDHFSSIAKGWPKGKKRKVEDLENPMCTCSHPLSDHNNADHCSSCRCGEFWPEGGEK